MKFKNNKITVPTTLSSFGKVGYWVAKSKSINFTTVLDESKNIIFAGFKSLWIILWCLCK